MWDTKTFTTEAAQVAWSARNSHRYQIEVIVVANGYGVNYRALRRVY